MWKLLAASQGAKGNEVSHSEVFDKKPAVTNAKAVMETYYKQVVIKISIAKTRAKSLAFFKATKNP